MTTVEENLFFMQLQAAELRLWTNEWDDDELAFQLQIEEALRFSMETWIGSTSKASVHKCCTTGVLSETGFISQAGVPDDHKTAFLEQKLEVESLQQVVDDEAEALREQARLEELRAICDHDAKFVRHLSSPSIPDTRKDHLENPFTFHSDGLKGTLDEAWGLEVIMASMNLTHATDVATSSRTHSAL
ncbi:hypothetical protein AXG93_4908s1180 [Marchantia polymorpha subsp. ruderalis]|uniref:Uncharacterized protein n=1 Tax=Marchantia polymorpha subsp. ruderalis TaxID=1480154 RepID=A0A176WBP3_MARPO|nr:hypothetical protein AXG93_4908s1180 [Marchantia polymorpha subsp. ruderalis]